MVGEARRWLIHAFTTSWVRQPDVNGPEITGWTWRDYLRVTPRGLAVLGFGVAEILRGWAYLLPVRPDPVYALIEQYLATPTVGVLWIVLGVWHLFSGLLRRWVLVLSVDVGVYLCWGVALAVGGYVASRPTGYASAANYLALAIAARVVLTMMDPPVARGGRVTKDVR